MKRIFVILLLIITVCTCRDNTKTIVSLSRQIYFDPNSLRSDIQVVNESSGQLLYLPAYSKVPYQIDKVKFDMIVFVAIHNTDMDPKIYLTKVIYFNQDGKLVDDFLKTGNLTIEPMATKDYFIPHEDQSGTGANSLIEWIADSVVNEPLIESVTLYLKPNNTVALLS